MDDFISMRDGIRASEYEAIKRTGGPAEGGITVRDYFAAKALSGFIPDELVTPTHEEMAKACYDLADAMMKVRNQKIAKPETCTVEEAFGLDK